MERIWKSGRKRCLKVERCAGIDVVKKFIEVCVLIGPVNGKPAEEVRRFGTHVGDLEASRAMIQTPVSGTTLGIG